MGESLDSYDFAHAVLELYRFIWSELCDWYLETVKPRLYDGDEDASAVLLFVLERVLALAHPFIPFVTEEIWSYLPAGAERQLVVSPFPAVETERIDEAAEAEIGEAIELTRALRRWRDLAGVEAQAVLARALAGRAARAGRQARPLRVHRRRRAGEVVTSVGAVEVLASAELDADRVARRVEERCEKLRAEVERGERKLANEGFVAKAPPEVVEAEREKLDGYRAELAELCG